MGITPPSPALQEIVRRRSGKSVGVLLSLLGVAIAVQMASREPIPSVARSGPARAPGPPDMPPPDAAHAPARQFPAVGADAYQAERLALVETALHHPDPAVRLEATYRLGELGDALSLMALEQTLQDEDRRVRRVAIDVLSVNPSRAVADLLIRAQANDDPRVRNLAHEVLQDLRSK
jgi:hypothetical protein